MKHVSSSFQLRENVTENFDLRHHLARLTLHVLAVHYKGSNVCVRIVAFRACQRVFRIRGRVHD